MTHLQQLDTIGIDAICQRIEAGESQVEIQRGLKVSIAALNAFLKLPGNLECSARARSISAESWLDKGLAAIESSMSKSGDIDPHAARAYAQECARRAAIRNPQYRERTSVDVTGTTINIRALLDLREQRLQTLDDQVIDEQQAIGNGTL